MQTKICARCKTEKSVSCFSLAPNSKHGDGFAYACIDCMSAMTDKQKAALVTAEWRKRNLDRSESHRVRSHLKRSSGIAPEEYQALMAQQTSVCAICGEKSTLSDEFSDESGRVQALSVDHDRTTGAVRRLLCGLCNQGLSSFRDDPKLLTAAIAYLKKHR